MALSSAEKRAIRTLRGMTIGSAPRRKSRKGRSKGKLVSKTVTKTVYRRRK